MKLGAGRDSSAAIARPPVEDLVIRAEQAVDAACDYLLNRQTSEGYWVGEAEGDTTLESDYVLLQLWLHQPGSDGKWNPPTRALVDAACRHVADKQLEDGGWNIYPQGPANINASVKAYCALKLCGQDRHSERLRRAAKRIVALGGVEAANSYTKLYLSYFDLYRRSDVPSIPPEIFLLPAEHHFGIYSISSWSRAMLAPLSILGATRARRRVPEGFSIEELFSGHAAPAPALLSWKRFFLLLDKTIKFLESTAAGRHRERGIEAARDWMVARLERSDGLGAIFPAMVNSIMALTQLGYDSNHPLLRAQLAHFDNLILHDERGFRVQPCHSPVWDTALTTHAIGAAKARLGDPARWALGRAADWLLAKQACEPGDWAVRNPHAAPGGWFFEYRNDHYPDTDDTAEVLLALEYTSAADGQRQVRAEERALEWLAAMQSSDGGWAAFDVDSCAAILNHVPFADHNAMLDPSCVDITGRVLETLCRRAPGRYRERVLRGVEYIRRMQHGDGCWYGRWGVNYIYGTCFALRGLRAAGVLPWDSAVIRAGEWVRSLQNADGGWGESPDSYDDPALRARGESTPSQTAWALMALLATEDYESGSVGDGVRYLLERQTPQGTWAERAHTGTGFPSVFYLRYHMYPQYFPLLALGEYARKKGAAQA